MNDLTLSRSENEHKHITFRASFYKLDVGFGLAVEINQRHAKLPCHFACSCKSNRKTNPVMRSNDRKEINVIMFGDNFEERLRKL